jgi:hypothetical protein
MWRYTFLGQDDALVGDAVESQKKVFSKVVWDIKGRNSSTDDSNDEELDEAGIDSSEDERECNNSTDDEGEAGINLSM